MKKMGLPTMLINSYDDLEEVCVCVCVAVKYSFKTACCYYCADSFRYINQFLNILFSVIMLSHALLYYYSNVHVYSFCGVLINSKCRYM